LNLISPLFSICIPAYKSRFLHECIKSILLQDYKNFELIILNDCSPEPVNDIVRTFNDSRIFYIQNEVNVGAEHLVKNWNYCLSLAKGDFIVMMGDDDVMEEDYLSEFIKLINKYPHVKVFHCRSKVIDAESKPTGLTQSWPEYESVYDTIWHRINDHRSLFISDFVYSKTFLDEVGGFYDIPLAWGSDDITAYIAAYHGGLAHTNKTVFKYRRSRYTISSGGSVKLKMNAICKYSMWLKDFLEKEPVTIDDQILHQNLKQIAFSRMQRRKVYILSSSLDKGFLSSLIQVIKFRKEYQINYRELIFVIVDYLKRKVTKTTYSN
jgi:glycosyltransferase involved in cell wall biosynthesis